MDVKKFKPRGKWSFFWFTLIFGLILALFGVTIGIGFSVRIPFTNINLSGGGALGNKLVVIEALPVYLRNRVADNRTFINQSNTVTIWVVEGIGVCVLGEQPEAPVINLSINLKK